MAQPRGAIVIPTPSYGKDQRTTASNTLSKANAGIPTRQDKGDKVSRASSEEPLLLLRDFLKLARKRVIAETSTRRKRRRSATSEECAFAFGPLKALISLRTLFENTQDDRRSSNDVDPLLDKPRLVTLS